jgi:hypothetical protein
LGPTRARFALALAALLVLGAGCRAVEPWERGRLADYVMRPDRDPLRVSLQDHMWTSREAASGGERVGGGGCGCN